MKIPAALDVTIMKNHLRPPSPTDEPPDPRTPLFWFMLMNPDHAALTSAMIANALEHDDETLAITLVSILHASNVASRSGQVFFALIFQFSNPRIACREPLLRHLPRLAERTRAAPDHRFLRIAWLMTGLWLSIPFPIHGASLSVNSNGELGKEADRMLRDADRNLGKARKSIREGEPVDWYLLDLSAKVLRYLGSARSALRAVYQLLAALPEPCVGNDLRFWSEPGEPEPPAPWVCVPQMFSWILQSLLPETEADPSLKEEREDFARFLLDRLKDRRDEGESARKGTARSPLEPRPEWRVAICEAVGELAVNPDGRGHHVLHRVSREDTDEDVRKAAARIYEVMRHSDGSTGGLSPRLLLFRAFWWLRQGQLLALGVEPDPAGAQSTRNREVRMTGSGLWP